MGIESCVEDLEKQLKPSEKVLDSNGNECAHDTHLGPETCFVVFLYLMPCVRFRIQ